MTEVSPLKVMKFDEFLDDELFFPPYLFFFSQEKMIDLESEVEELHDSEQRWAAKHKRAIEQVNTEKEGLIIVHRFLNQSFTFVTQSYEGG